MGSCMGASGVLDMTVLMALSGLACLTTGWGAMHLSCAALCSHAFLRVFLRHRAVLLHRMVIASPGKWLGVIIGPDSAPHRRSKAIDQYESRTRDIKRQGYGLDRAALLHNTYALPILQFLAQISAPPPAVVRRYKVCL